MSRDLKTLRDWARKMAEATEPQVVNPRARVRFNQLAYPGGPGERALWKQIADEIDAFLAGDEIAVEQVAGQVELFEAIS